MNNTRLKELREYLEGGDPLKDYADECELVIELSEDLFQAREAIKKLKTNPRLKKIET